MMDTFEVEGAALAYELSGGRSEGVAEGGPVVLLNGIAMSIAHWKPFVAALTQARAPARRVLAHDFRGQLLSSRPAGPYSLEGHADDLSALMSALDLDRAHIVGTSYGSEVALVFARKYPERTLSLTVIDGASEADPVLRAAVGSWKAAALADPVAFYRALIPWTYSASYIASHEDALAARESAVAGLPRDFFAAFAALCDAFLEIDETPRLGEIRCPTLVLVGERDILKHRGYAEIIARGVRGARLEVLAGLGHAAVIEDPAAVLACVEPFLEEAEKRL
jgi:3-oxoadipate enol-lactonase